MELITKKRGRKPKNMIDEPTQENQVTIVQGNIIDINDDICNSNIEEGDSINLCNNKFNQLWTEKYKPKTIADFISNKQEIDRLYKWLQKFNDKTNMITSAVIIGGHGVGKSSIINILLKTLGYDIKNIYCSDLKNKDTDVNIIQSYEQSLNKKKYAVVVNNIENITIKSEKNNLLSIYKYNKDHHVVPLLLISNLQHSKLTETFKQKSLTFEFTNPTLIQLRNFVNKIAIAESILFENDELIDKIIHFAQFDIRRLLFVLQDLYTTFKEKITNELFKKYQHISQRKNIDIGLILSAKEILDHYRGVPQCMQLYESDKVLLPLMIYENYYRRIFAQKGITNEKILETMSDVINSISVGDVIETNIYADQNWFLQDIHGFYTCVNTSYILNKQPCQLKNYSINFSADLNKTSSKKINKKKNIQPLQLKIKDKTLEDILYINKIISDLKIKKSPELKKIQETYNLSKKDIDNTLKIDKTTSKYVSKKISL